MATLKNLQELLIDELRDLYSAETQLTKALPKMAKAANNPELKAGFEEHLTQTQGHLERLTQVFAILDEKAKGKTCHAMEGLVEEGKEAIELDAPEPVQDAALIGAAQRVEHYEVAAYGTARAFATALGMKEIADLLLQTEKEESETDKKLTGLAKKVNQDAKAIPIDSED